MKKIIRVFFLLYFLWNISYASSQEQKINTNQNELTQNAVDKFFSTTNCLPPKAQKSLQKILKNNPSSATPVEVNAVINNVKTKRFELTEGQGLSATLHAFSFPPSNELKYLTGAESYDTLNPFLLLNKQKPNFFYSLDCSGYISYLASVNGGLSEANVASSSKLAYNKKEIYMIGRLYVYPLIAKIMDKNGSKVDLKLDSASVSSTLFTLLNALITNNKSSVSVPEFIDVLAYERRGDKSLQGEIELKGKAGANFGYGSASLALQSVAGMGQNLSFYVPTIGIIEKGGDKTYSIDQVKQKLQEAIESTELSQEKNNSNLKFKSNLPRNICENEKLMVSITKVGDTPVTLLKNIKLSPKYDDNESKCEFILSLNGIENQFISPSFFTASIFPSRQSSVFSIYGQNQPKIALNFNY